MALGLQSVEIAHHMEPPMPISAESTHAPNTREKTAAPLMEPWVKSISQKPEQFMSVSVRKLVMVDRQLTRENTGYSIVKNRYDQTQ